MGSCCSNCKENVPSKKQIIPINITYANISSSNNSSLEYPIKNNLEKRPPIRTYTRFYNGKNAYIVKR